MAFFDHGNTAVHFTTEETGMEVSETDGSLEYVITFPEGHRLRLTEREAEQLYMNLHSALHSMEDIDVASRGDVVEIAVHDVLGMQTLYLTKEQLSNFTEGIARVTTELFEDESD